MKGRAAEFDDLRDSVPTPAVLSRASGDAASSDPTDIKLEQVALLYKMLPVGIVYNAAACLILVGVILFFGPQEGLILWLAAALLLNLARAGLSYAYQRTDASRLDPDFWLASFSASVFLLGVVWSVPGFMVASAVGITPVQGLVVVALCTLGAGAVASFCVVERVFLAFAIPAMLPLAGYLLLIGSAEQAMLGIFLAGFFGFLVTSCGRVHSVLHTGLRLKLENARLLADLVVEKQQVELLNADLEDRVAERTAEVVASINLLQAEIVERNIIENELQRSVEEKDVLMREVHHRVKNNFQIIISLLNLQGRQSADLVIRKMFDNCAARIRSISIVHDQLYRARDLTAISFSEYLEKLVQNVCGLHDLTRIKVDVSVPDVIVGIDTASFCGLMVNELLSNTFEHAFKDGRDGMVSVRVHVHDNGELEIICADNGVGLPAQINLEAPGSLGLELINLFVSQIAGTLSVERENGTTFRIRFPFNAPTTKEANLA